MRGRAGASPEWTLLQVCVYLDGSNVGQNFTAGYTLYNYVCKKIKKKIKIQNQYIFFFTKPITDNGKMLKYREKYR